MSNKIKTIQKKIIPILKKNGVKRASIFGSYARGEQTDRSDIDIMIEFVGKRSLLDLVGLEQDLENKTGIRFDVSTYNSISRLIKDQVMKEQIVIMQ